MAKAKKTSDKTEKIEKKIASKRAIAGLKDYGILLRPVVTEKSAGYGSSRAVFRVAKEATKDEVRDAVERVFGVKVVSVNTVNYLGKPKRTTRSAGYRAGYKKAYVTLAEGQSINVVEGL